MKPLVIALAAALCSAACHTGAASADNPGMPGSTSAIVAGRSASDFSAPDLEGNTITLSSYLGNKVVLLDFYTTWCEPCVAELPHLRRLYEQEKDNGFVIIAIAMDGPETIANVPGFVQRNNVKFPMVIDDESRIASAYNPQKTAPFIVLIDRKGKVTATRSGYTAGDERILASEIAKLMPKASTSR